MSTLPPGWTVSNRSGQFQGPDLGEDSDDDDLHVRGLDIRPDSPGWEDMEDDSEQVSVKCLLCDDTFASTAAVASMLVHSNEIHGFDLLAIRKLHKLDFYSTIKLVNYIRNLVKSHASSGEVFIPDTSDPSLWQDDQFLSPALEDDALLFSLDELVEFGQEADEKIADYDERERAVAAKEQSSELEPVEE